MGQWLALLLEFGSTWFTSPIGISEYLSYNSCCFLGVTGLALLCVFWSNRDSTPICIWEHPG